MTRLSFPRIVIHLCIVFGIAGCGKSPPAEPPVATEVPTISKAPGISEAPVLIPTSTATVGERPVTKAAPAISPTVAIAAEKAPFPDAAFLTDDIVGLAVTHPRRIMEQPVVQMLKQAGLTAGVEEQSGLSVKPESIERITLVVDQASVDELARSGGLQVVSLEPTVKKTTQAPVKNQLKQLGLAFHNYESVHRSFPRADAAGDGKNSGLSWRVHLLPYLEQKELYEQFRLDEPWDSDHNKTLIEQMPAIFRSPGTDEPGKTALHVISGENTAVNTFRGVRVRDVIDGTSNTLLVVAAGPDTADIWTKPGGLAFDRKTPRKSLGDFGATLFVTMCDGAVVPVSTDCSDQTLADLMQINDGNTLGEYLQPPVRSEPRPLVILTFVTVDQTAFIKGFLGESTEESFESQSLHKNEFNAVCFVDGMTAVCGPIESVRKLVTTHASGEPGSPEILQQLETGADFSFALDIKSQASLLEQVIERIPELGIIQHLELVSFQFNLSGKSGATLLQLVARTANEDSASMLSQFARVGLLQAQKTLTSMRLPAETADRQAAELARSVAQSATIDQAGTRIELRIPVPEGIEKLPELLQPSIDSAAQSAARMQQTNRLRKIALGFHSYHDAHQKFPGAGQSADGKSGLSWRVHILPYVDEGPLYNEFNLSEPWDSETNKKLIEKMPKIYEVKGVAAGKTSLHVFTGTGAPFANDQLPEFADFTDGLSNTLLIVQAATDTAEIWTRPGGLDFDPKKPVQSLGKQLEDEFLGVIADGSVRVISKAISANNLRRLIQFQDGEVLE